MTAMPRFVSSTHPLVNAAGREYHLRLWRPAAPRPAQGLRSLLFLDGQWLDDTLSCALAESAPAGLQVASLGYRTGERSVIAPWRAYDYTPAAPGERQCDPRSEDWPCGGADALLAFLRNDVLPLLGADAGAGSALFGHSYAGLFSLYCRERAPTLFSHIYSASPSLWWYWPRMLTQLEAGHGGAEPRRGGGPPVHLMVGGDERWRPKPAFPGLPREPGVSTVPMARRYCAALRELDAPADLEVFDGQAHGPMLHSAAKHALRQFTRSCGGLAFKHESI